jgi:hypothetical protein
VSQLPLDRVHHNRLLSDSEGAEMIFGIRRVFDAVWQTWFPPQIARPRSAAPFGCFRSVSPEFLTKAVSGATEGGAVGLARRYQN